MEVIDQDMLRRAASACRNAQTQMRGDKDWFSWVPDHLDQLADRLTGCVVLQDEPNHYVTFNDDGWFIEHSVACRQAGTLGTCEFNVGIMRFADDVAHVPMGRWLIRGFDAHGTPALERADA